MATVPGGRTTATWIGPASRAVIADHVHPVNRGEATGKGHQRGQRGIRGGEVAGVARERAQGEQRVGSPRGTRGGDPVAGVARSAHEEGRIDRRVEEAALTVDEPLEDDVEQLARDAEPALVPGHLVERQEPLREVRIVLQDSRGVSADPAPE